MYPYSLYESTYASLAPARLLNDASRLALAFSPLPYVAPGLARALGAGAEMFERMTRRYDKPRFGLAETAIDGRAHPVTEEIAWTAPFCRLVRFAKGAAADGTPAPDQPTLLVVAPLSGHHATLLRGTVEGLLPGADVYVTDWVDARLVPVSDGRFDLDDYVDYVRAILRHLGPGTHVLAVCQPSVPVLAATALMEADGEPCAPASLTLMGGPIDTRLSPTAVNDLATEKGMAWFRGNTITTVPYPNPGRGRRVYPGYAQLAGFVSMNLDRHVKAHESLFAELVNGDEAGATRRKEFYDEYLAVLDLTEEYYLQTIETVFVNHDLPRGTMVHRGRRVDPGAIRRAALLTVEGEKDDITGAGQTHVAHDLCPNVAADRRERYTQAGVGHYGVFSGGRFLKEIAPRILAFVARSGHAPAAEAA